MRIVIAEDSAVIRAGLAEILADRGHVVVAAVGNAEDLQSAVNKHHPDAAVVDGCRRLRRRGHPRCDRHPPRPSWHWRAGLLPVHRDPPCG